MLDIVDELNENGLPDVVILVSFDIVNMFPSIDNKKGIDAVRSALISRELLEPSTECIIEGLEICLFNNNSTFAGDHLLQINRTATGDPNSFSYADLAVYPIDQEVFRAIQSTYQELMYFGSYRDDYLGLWHGSIEKLYQFFEFLNSLNPDLKFTMEIGNDTICFLDLKISIVQNQLFTTVYSKPTDSHMYLHDTSCHSKQSIVGIQKGVALRLRRIYL